MAEKKLKMRKAAAEPKVDKVPFAALQEKGGMFFEPFATNPMGKQNPMEKRRDLKNAKK
jgi:hypothetical protein